jgi:hypothetical protein
MIESDANILELIRRHRGRFVTCDSEYHMTSWIFELSRGPDKIA